ncbi:ComF family protein [Flavobacterium silvaticum]|uniref:ComF family protein n=1 Tax=Flavobacterium silvaticum TaxID=1852020 RepID=A0A972JH81_9FLAO|nr:phosphoribosyltransferase family protein [Flavobacterium silvaticum]NMH27660.1 ComF family protein [Flavobacterium silvaticum]
MLHALLHLFFPELCSGCKKILSPSEALLCLRCRHEIPFTRHEHLPQNEAFTKFYGRVEVESVQCMLSYQKEGIVKNCIHRLKYQGKQEIGTLFGLWFCADAKRLEQLSGIDYIIPVPLHPKKLKKRGYNQVTTFANTISQKTGIKVAENILFRNYNTSTQTKKNLFSRSQLKSELFEAIDNPEYYDCHLLIVDDVLTTGATLENCIRALHKLRNCRISVACMAFSQS